MEIWWDYNCNFSIYKCIVLAFMVQLIFLLYFFFASSFFKILCYGEKKQEHAEKYVLFPNLNIHSS